MSGARANDMSDILFHRAILSDSERVERYGAAVRQVVRPGDTVLDVGTGTGILAFFACRAGASRVYAVDPSEIIAVARQLAHDNGFADRIVFLQSDVRAVELPEKVDVLISELIGRAVIGERMEELVTVARDRCLKPGGRIIPQSVELWIAPVEAPALYESCEFPPEQAYGIDFASARPLVFNLTYGGTWHGQQDDLLAEPALAHEVATAAGRRFRELEASLEFRATRPGTLHGFVGWFSAGLAPGVTLSGAPPGLRTWSHAFWPILQPVPLEEGMHVALDLGAMHLPGMEPLWRWSTTVRAPAGAGCDPVAQFRQDTCSGLRLTRAALWQSTPEYLPRLTDSGRIEHLILGWLDGRTTIADMARALVREHPEAARSLEEANQLIRRTVLRHKADGHVR